MFRGFRVEGGLRCPVSVVLEVRDVVDYVYCPFKAYLKKVLGMREALGREAELGRLVHEAYYASMKGLEGWEALLEAARRVGYEEPPEWAQEAMRSAVEFRRRLGVFNGEVEVQVRSEELGVSGRIDAIEGGVPVEVKNRGEAWWPDLIQLTWYVLLLEWKTGAEVNVGYLDLVKAGRRLEVKVGSRLREAAVNLRDRLLRDLHVGPPSVKAKGRRCDSCGLRMECEVLVA